MFDIRPTKSYKLTNADLFSNNGKVPVVTNSSVNNGITGYSNLLATEHGNIITYSDTTTSDGIFYQPHSFVGYSHIQGLYPKIYNDVWNSQTLLFVVVQFKKIASGKFSYGNKFNRAIAREFKIILPTKNKKPDFDFMKSFIAELEAQRIAELEAYLTVTGLKDYELTENEQKAIHQFNSVKWMDFNLKELFGRSTRGKRLKSDDRIPGELPFITAGEANQGFSDYIGNSVEVFKKNTTTIDMFGSAKYRNYNYGGDDHIAVVHTEKLPKYAAIFVTTACHKSSHNGQFDYGKNFYAKDADQLFIKLPVQNDQPDYTYMAMLISAIHKMVIKDVVLYADKKIAATKTVVDNM